MDKVAEWKQSLMAYSYDTIRDGFRFGWDSRIRLPLYRATKRQWAEAFFTDGSLRLNTLWDYRRAEHAPGIADADEGVVPITKEEGEKPFQALVTAMDAYMLSLSEDYIPDRFEAADYDAAFRINDHRFFIEIARALQKHINLKGAMVCRMIYAKQDELAEEIRARLATGTPFGQVAPPAAFIKNPDSAGDREVRAWFEPEDDVNLALYREVGTELDEGYIAECRARRSLLAPLYLKVPAAIPYTTPIRNCGVDVVMILNPGMRS